MRSRMMIGGRERQLGRGSAGMAEGMADVDRDADDCARGRGDL